MEKQALKKKLKQAHTVTLIFPVKNEELVHILSGCFHNGSTYWLNSVDVEDEEYCGADCREEVPACGGYLLLKEHEGRKVHKLGYRELLGGIVMYGHEQKKLDFENMDNVDYDMILQYSIFRKLKYS